MPLYNLAFYSALFFILGIGFASFEISFWLGIILAILLAWFGFSLRSKFIFILSLISFLGFFYFHFYNVLNQEILPSGDGQTFTGVVFREPKDTLTGQEVDLKLREPYQGEVRLYLPPLPKFGYGEVLEVNSKIEKSPSGSLNLVFEPGVRVIGQNQGNLIKSSLFGLKEKMVSNINSVLPQEKASLLSGLLFGERSEFTKEFDEALRKSGTTHIVALSGYNIAIIGTTLAGVLAGLIGRRKAFYLSIFTIPTFVLMTGAQSSAVRAGIMGLILLLAQNQSRIYSFRNAITLTALLMLLLNPSLLRFDLGFQLSFAATIGIVYLYPRFKNWIRFFGKNGWLNWRTTFLQTFSAQLAVSPILLTSFGYISPTALLSNILVLEAIPLTMFFGFITAALGLVSNSLSLISSWIVGLFLSYEIFVIKLFSLNWL
ncbi:MAG: ComEC/Rec2 family competence protein [Candidatus Colwellbacteria bacterium]|nr:ComEC/Rec2 family competence protein [Candidatus Colwellbacteria bacterium]